MFLRKRLVPGEIGTGLFCLRCWLSESGRGNDPQENEPWGEVARLLLRVLLECGKRLSGHRYTNLPDDGFEVLAENSFQTFARNFAPWPDGGGSTIATMLSICIAISMSLHILLRCKLTELRRGATISKCRGKRDAFDRTQGEKTLTGRL
jgi:hypothetical protein